MTLCAEVKGQKLHSDPWEMEKGALRSSLLWHAWLPGALFVLLVILFETTDLDLWLSDLFFDFSRKKFFWKEAWWATGLIHTGGRPPSVGTEVSSSICSHLSDGPTAR